MSVYEPRSIVRSIEPRNCDPMEVICGQSELTEVLAAAIAAGQHIVSVSELWSIHDEEEAFLESCPEEALEAAF